MGKAIIRSAADIDLGQNVNVVIAPESGSTFGNDRYLRLEFRFFNDIIALYNIDVSSSAQSYTFTGYNVPLSPNIYQYFSYSYGSLEVSVLTYSDATRRTLVGGNAKSFFIRIPRDLRPEFQTNPTYVIDNGTGQYKDVDFAVKDVSQIKITAKGQSSAGIRRYEIFYDFNVTHFATTAVSASELNNYAVLMRNKSNDEWGVSCQDNNLYWSDFATFGQIQVFDYKAPDITKCIIARVPNSENIQVLCDWNLYKKDNEQQTLSSARLYYKLKSAHTYSSYVNIASYKNVEYTITGSLFSATNSYDFKFVVTDNSNGFAEKYASIGTLGFTLDHLEPTDNSDATVGLAFGKAAEKHGCVEFAYNVDFYGYARINNEDIAIQSNTQRKKELLWMNTNASLEFGAEEVELNNFSQYSSVEIVAVQFSGDTQPILVSSFCPKLLNQRGGLYAVGATAYPYEIDRRLYTIRSDRIAFGYGEYFDVKNQTYGVQSTKILAPFMIYGYR